MILVFEQTYRHQENLWLTVKENISYLPGLSPVSGKELHARFNGGRLSSDGGILLLREIESGLGLADVISPSMKDPRDSSGLRHTHTEMIQARMFAIACGYEDWQLSRRFAFLSGVQAGLRASVRDRGRPDDPANIVAIVLDIDDTPDTVHGAQQLALFNAHYDEYIFQPIHIFDAATGKPVLSLLRPGSKRPSGKEAAGILKHVINRIRGNWPRTIITVRGDRHYGMPEVMKPLEDRGCSYILAFPATPD